MPDCWGKRSPPHQNHLLGLRLLAIECQLAHVCMRLFLLRSFNAALDDSVMNAVQDPADTKVLCAGEEDIADAQAKQLLPADFNPTGAAVLAEKVETSQEGIVAL